MQYPDDLRYSEEHEWVRLDGTRATVGITDFAQDALGDVVFVALPEVGGEVAAAASIAEVESTKSVSEIYAPVAGTVVAANADLEATPELVNRDPYGDGWIFAVEVADPSALDGLMDAAAYRALVGG
ncbi:MAG: glycine cleavage system protein GcvH [Actinomycetes bacterium]